MKTLAEVLSQAPTRQQMIRGSLNWFGLNVRVPVGYSVVLVPDEDLHDAEDRAGLRMNGKGIIYSKGRSPLAAV